MITIDDDDDDPISEMKLHLHESYISTGFQKSIEVVDVLDSPSYSPTQSPQRLSPIYLPPDCEISPPDSPSDCQVVEVSPPPPPLPPPPTLPPPPPPPPISIYPEPVPCLRQEPLPPGEDTAPEINFFPTSQAPLDMDLDSGDEAESQFFRLQKIEKEECIFPESVWGFGAPRSQEKNSPGRKRKEAEEKKEGEDLRRSKRRKRKSSSRDKENQKRIEKKEAPSLEDDEETLRAILLAQVSKAQTRKPAQGHVKEIQEDENGGTEPEAVKEAVIVDLPREKNSVAPSSNAPVVTRTDPKSLLSHPPPPPPVKPLPVEPTPTATSPLPPSARPVMTNPLPPSTRPGVKASKAPQPLKLAKPGKVSRRPSNSSMNKSLPTLSKADREKHFPNLSRKIIIPRIEDSSDSEGESEEGLPTKPSMAISSPSSMFGGLNLEAFLKEARNTAPAPSHSSSNKPAQPQKKFMMTPKLKAQAKKLTLADKKKLISSKISHLSRSTQIEFQRLKELLAKKEREKALAKKDGGKRTGDPRAVINSARPTGTPILANAEQEIPQSKPSEVSCEEVPKIHHSAPAQDSSATPLEPDAPVEKLSNPPSDAEPPPAEGDSIFHWLSSKVQSTRLLKFCRCIIFVWYYSCVVPPIEYCNYLFTSCSLYLGNNPAWNIFISNLYGVARMMCNN